MSQSVVVQGSLKHPIKSHNFNFSFKLTLKNKVYYSQTRARLEHGEIILYAFINEKTFRDRSSGLKGCSVTQCP